MVGKSKPQTRDERARMTALSGMPCLVSMLEYWNDVPAETHHVTEGGRRLGHRYTIRLSPWFHRGVVPDAFHGSVKEATRTFGPSLALDKAAFVKRWGTERDLVQIQDALVRMYWSKWHRGEFIPPAELGRLTRLLWAEIVQGEAPTARDIYG